MVVGANAAPGARCCGSRTDTQVCLKNLGRAFFTSFHRHPAPGASRELSGEMPPRAGGNLRGFLLDQGGQGEPPALEKGPREQGCFEGHRERASALPVSWPGLRECWLPGAPALWLRWKRHLQLPSRPHMLLLQSPRLAGVLPRAAAWSRGVCGPGRTGAAGSVRFERSRSFQRFLPRGGVDFLRQGELRLGRAALAHRVQTCLQLRGAASSSRQFSEVCPRSGLHPNPLPSSSMRLSEVLCPHVGPPGLLFPTRCGFKIKAGSQAVKGPDPPLLQGSRTQH